MATDQDDIKFPPGRLDLYLTEIGEPLDNQLRIVVRQASLGKSTIIDDPIFAIENVRQIEVTSQSLTWELYWSNYVAYAVRNESYWIREEGEPDFSGHLSRRINSAFMRYVTSTTFATDDYPGPLQHWALSTLNHCLDVISAEPPEIRLLDPAEAGRGPTSPNFAKG
ncbi:hypothetical protein [Sphingomonas sanxanigenens]|uniref:hypothetical protein n=1 Tax=Sphingomonas sanxanigenens TaxID=397260 RepID=UPI0013012AAC|nr:hypothetical protein [Sphingomonas sanxanigenens]